MSDADLRDLERRARAGDREARRRWRAGLLRLRDPRLDPIPGDVVRVAGRPERLVRSVTHAGRVSHVVWHKVLWLYGLDDGAGLCYSMRPMRCSLATWRRRARRGEVVRMGEEREREVAVPCDEPPKIVEKIVDTIPRTLATPERPQLPG